jgi:hypothetical protein
MPVDDKTRLNLHRKLEAVLGAEEANTLMAHLPPVTWHDVATKDDLRALESVMRSDMRAEFSTMRGETAADFAAVRVEIAGVRSEMHRSMVEQTRWMVGFICGWSAVVVGVARLVL